MRFAQVIQQGSAAVGVLVGVQLKQEVEVLLLYHVPSNPEAAHGIMART